MKREFSVILDYKQFSLVVSTLEAEVAKRLSQRPNSTYGRELQRVVDQLKNQENLFDASSP